MQAPLPLPLEPGLKTLTSPANLNRSLSCKKPNILSFCSSSSSSSSSLSSLSLPPSPSRSSPSSMDEATDHVKEREVPCHFRNDNANTNANDDGIGKEMEKEEEEEEEKTRIVLPQVKYRRRRSFQEEKEYPPPIPLLARTGNLLCHMPWVLKRSYTDNGRRLVIQEVKVRHHEYFRAHRANGRLTLQIIQLDESSTFLRSGRPESPIHSTKIQERAKKGNVEDKTDEEASSSSSPPQSSPSSSSEITYNDDQTIAAVETTSHVPPMSPSSLPPPASMLSKELKSILDLNRGNAPHEYLGTRDDKNVREVMETGTMPSILSSSMPESSFSIGGGNAGGCYVNKRSNSLFSTPIPTIRPVHS